MRTIAQLYSLANRAGLCDAATWTPFGGSPATVNGYFDAMYSPDLMTEAARPSFRAPKSVLVAVAQGDAMTVGGVSYTVAEIATDTPDPGELMLFLRRAT